MMGLSYQRRHLRAPFKESVLFGSEGYLLKARALNISEGGLHLNELPSFPTVDEVPMLISIPKLPQMKNFDLFRMQTFSTELYGRNVIRLRGRMVRKEELASSLDSIFRSKVGLEFTWLDPKDQKLIEEYVLIFCSNLVFLQTLIDSYSSDEETRSMTWSLAKIMGYKELGKISELRTQVGEDYRGMQWL